MLMGKRISYILIATLIAIVVLQRSCISSIKNEDKEQTIVTDTIWKTKYDTVVKTATVFKKEYIHIDKPEYTSGETIDTCKTRFENLLKEHLVRTIYSDTIKLDSIGTLVIRDTVWTNKLYGKRSVTTNYKIPIVTKTIIKKEEPKRQLYIGGNVFGNPNFLQSASPGILYKNKKDQVYQFNVALNFDGTITYGLGAYWKIKLK